jgi:hypothetical protein
VTGQFVFVVFIAVIQVAGRTVPRIAHGIVAGPVPGIEAVGFGCVEVEGSFLDIAAEHDDFLIFPHVPAVISTGNFGNTFENINFGLPSFIDVNPVHTFVQQEDSAVGGLDFDIFFKIKVLDIHVNTTLCDPETHRGFPQFGNTVEFHFGIVIQAQVIQTPQVKFDPAFRGTHYIFFKDRQVIGGLFEPFLKTAFDKGFSFGVFNPKHFCVIVIFGFKFIRAWIIGKAKCI